ncbi:OmpA family protein [bacterium]|nr:OmpA family protein [bacterium]
MTSRSLLFLMTMFGMILIFFHGSPGAEPVNMLSLQEGALPVIVPAHYTGWNPEFLLDDSPESGWACTSGSIKDNVFVFELIESVALERFEFDNTNVDDEGAGARDILVELSETSAQDGFSPALETSLAAGRDGQSFELNPPKKARWVRLTIKNNHGNAEWTELLSIRAFGPRPASTTPNNISGTFDSSYAQFHVRQQGTALTGCYEYDQGLIDGTIEGRIMKLTWREAGGPDDQGPAIMVFPPDGQSFRGYYWHNSAEKKPPAGTWDGKKTSDQVGGCPHWTGSLSGELHKQLSTTKRARLYGILFDFNAAQIKAESKAVLDEVLTLLNKEPTWTLTIEGHTDSIGSDQQNLDLSQKRAEAVKAYLTSAGIPDNRLKTVGLGETQPVADNASELGRAQNRRVELVRD